MSKYFICLALIASTSGYQFKATIFETVGGETRGVVNPSECGGGVGEFIEMRVTDCVGETRPCKLTATSVIDIDFIASINTTNADLIFTARAKDGASEIVTEQLGSMPGGKRLTLTLSQFGELIISQEVDLEMDIRNDADAREICLRASFNEEFVGTTIKTTAGPTTITTDPTTTIGTTTTTDAPTTSSISTTTAGTTVIFGSMATLIVTLMGATQFANILLTL